MRTSWPTSGGGTPQGANLGHAWVHGWEFHGLQEAEETPIRPPLDSFGPADPPLPIRPLLEQVRWSPKRYPERNPESWVLQPTLRGPVWRYERWADRHKDVYAVAVLGTPAGRATAERKPFPSRLRGPMIRPDSILRAGRGREGLSSRWCIPS